MSKKSRIKRLERKVGVLKHLIASQSQQLDEVFAVLWGPEEVDVLMDNADKREREKLN